MESRLELTVDSRSAERHLRRLDGELRRVDNRGRTAAAAMGKFSLAVGAISAAAGGLGFSRIIKETAAFEDAMLGLQAVSGATTKQMADLEKQARTLGATSMFSAQQAGEAQRFLAQAGFEVNEVLSATPGILNLATAASIDLGRAADIASNILGGFRLEVDQLNRVNDVLAATAAGSNTSVEQLGEALSYAAPIAAAAGISVEEAAAAVGTLSDAGLQASRAGTGILGFVRQLSNLTPTATEALEGYGLTAAEVNIESEGLATVLGRLSKANINTADSFKIFGSEAGPAAQILANGSERVREFTGELGEAEGAADRAALIIGDGLTGSMRGFNSMLSESILQLGDSGLAGGFEAVTDTATGMLAVYNGMLPEFAEANSLTETQADVIRFLATGMEWLGNAAIVAAGIYSGRLVSALAAGTVSLKNKTMASIADAKAESAAAAATVRRTGAEKQSALALLSTTRLEEQATRGTAAHTFALQQLSVARTRAATAAGAHTTAMNVATAATTRASVAARGLSGALALVGGPLGLLVGVGGLLYVFREELGAVQQKAGLTEDQIEDLKDEMSDLSNAQLGTTLSQMGVDLDAMTLKAAAAREELAALRSDNRGSGVLGFEGGSVGEEIRGMQAVAEAQARIAEINDEIAVARGEASERIQQNAKVFNDSLNDSEDEANALREELAKLEGRLDSVGAAEKRYSDQMQTLNKALAEGEISQDRYNELKGLAVERLNEAREAANGASGAIGGLASTTEDAAIAASGYASELDSLLDRITPNRREAKQYARDLNLLNLALASGGMEAKEYMQAMGMLQQSFQAAQRDTEDLADTTTDSVDEMSREWERFGNAVDDTFVDAFKGAFDSFDDFADRLKGAFEDLLAELAYAAVKNEIKIQLGMQGSGPMSGGIGDIANIFSSGNGSSGGLGGVISGAKSLFGFGGSSASAGGLYSTAATGAAQGGLYGNVATGGVAGTSGAAGGLSGLASAAGPAMAMYAAAKMGDSLLKNVGAYDALGIRTDGRTSQGLGQIMPIGGTIIGSGLDALGIGGYETEFSGRFGTSASGTGFEHQGNEGSEGQFYRQGAFGTVGFMDQGTERLQRAGTGSKEWADNLAASAAQMDNLVASLARSEPELQAMTSAVQGLETSSGNAADIIDFALKERPRAAINAMSGDFGAFVRTLEGDIEQVVSQAQSAGAAYDLLSNNSERLGIQFNVTGGYAYEAAQSVAEFAGGVQNLDALHSSYYQNFFSDAERAANVTDDLTESLASMGLQMPETRDGFRDLVSAQDLSTESGRQTYAQLLQLSSAFADVTPATEAATQAVEDNTDAQREREGLERELLRLQGDTAALRQLELDELDPANRALQNRIWALEDAKEADDKAAEAADRRAAAMDRARDQLAGFTTNINDWLNGLQSTDQGLGSPGDQLAAASAAFDEQYRKAMAGDRDALGSITQYANRFIDAQKGWSASGEQTVSTIDRVTGMLEKLPERLSAEQFLADEFKGIIGEQTVTLSGVFDAGFSNAVAALSRDFDQIDGNLDGLLTFDEIKLALGDKATDAQISALIAAVDTNGDGMISQQELANAKLGGLADGIGSALGPMFDAIDLDTSGLIDYDEFGKQFAGMASDAELRNIFNAIDANGDGTISELEAVNASTQDITDTKTEGMKVSIGRHHNPSGLVDMAYNWATQWGNMGAPGFSGAGGGELEYSKPSSSSSSTSGGSNSSTSGGSGSSSSGSSSSGSPSPVSSIPSGAKRWIEQFEESRAGASWLSVDYL